MSYDNWKLDNRHDEAEARREAEERAEALADREPDYDAHRDFDPEPMGEHDWRL